MFSFLLNQLHTLVNHNSLDVLCGIQNEVDKIKHFYSMIQMTQNVILPQIRLLDQIPRNTWNLASDWLGELLNGLF